MNNDFRTSFFTDYSQDSSDKYALQDIQQSYYIATLADYSGIRPEFGTLKNEFDVLLALSPHLADDTHYDTPVTATTSVDFTSSPGVSDSNTSNTACSPTPSTTCSYSQPKSARPKWDKVEIVFLKKISGPYLNNRTMPMQDLIIQMTEKFGTKYRSSYSENSIRNFICFFKTGKKRKTLS